MPGRFLSEHPVSFSMIDHNSTSIFENLWRCFCLFFQAYTGKNALDVHKENDSRMVLVWMSTFGVLVWMRTIGPFSRLLRYANALVPVMTDTTSRDFSGPVLTPGTKQGMSPYRWFKQAFNLNHVNSFIFRCRRRCQKCVQACYSRMKTTPPNNELREHFASSA